MDTNLTEKLLQEIGSILAIDTDYPVEGTLLYAQVGDGYVSPAIYRDQNDQITYSDPLLNEISPALMALWEAQASAPRWEEMEYLIRHGRFEVTYVYPDEIDPDEEPFDRRDRIVARYFGDKPIVYSEKDRADP